MDRRHLFWTSTEKTPSLDIICKGSIKKLDPLNIYEKKMVEEVIKVLKMYSWIKMPLRDFLGQKSNSMDRRHLHKRSIEKTPWEVIYEQNI